MEYLNESVELKSKIKKIYRSYSDEFAFAGYALAGSAVAVAVATGFGLPLGAALGGNLAGAAANYGISKFRDSNFKENYENFIDAVSKREVILAPLNKLRNKQAKFYKEAVKPILIKIFADIKLSGGVLLKTIEDKISEIDKSDEEFIELKKIRRGIKAAVKQELVSKGEDDFIVESPFVVKAAYSGIRFGISLVKKNASSRSKKALADLKYCDGNEDSPCIKRSLTVLQMRMAEDLYHDVVTVETYTPITKMIVASYSNGALSQQLRDSL